MPRRPCRTTGRTWSGWSRAPSTRTRRSARRCRSCPRSWRRCARAWTRRSAAADAERGLRARRRLRSGLGLLGTISCGADTGPERQFLLLWAAGGDCRHRVCGAPLRTRCNDLVSLAYTACRVGPAVAPRRKPSVDVRSPSRVTLHLISVTAQRDKVKINPGQEVRPPPPPPPTLARIWTLATMAAMHACARAKAQHRTQSCA